MADDFSVGAGAVFNESPYKGYNENVSAAPLISYEGEHFYVRQTTGGWIVWKDAKNELEPDRLPGCRCTSTRKITTTT